MTDRLTRIWAGFAKRATIDLSGTDVENTPRPSGAERAPASLSFDSPIAPPREGAEPVDTVKAALDAMHTAMAAAPAKTRGKDRPSATMTVAPTSSLEKTLFADVAYTQTKVQRGASDYIAYAADRQLNWQKRRKKWFFGLF